MISWKSSFFIVLIGTTAIFAVIPPVASYEEEANAQATQPTRGPVVQEVIERKHGRRQMKREMKKKRKRFVYSYGD